MDEIVKFPVILCGMRQYGGVRMVEVPKQFTIGTTINTLENVFANGQHDFQPDPERRSVSVGDVVVMPDGSFWRVEGLGWQRVSPFFLSERQMANVGGALISWADSNLDKPADGEEAPGYEKQQRDVEDLNDKIRSTLKGLRGEFDE